MASVAVSYGTTAISGGLNEDTWDDVLCSSSISYWTSYAGSAVGSEVESVKAGGAGEGNGSLKTEVAGWSAGGPREQTEGTIENRRSYLESGEHFDVYEGEVNCLGYAISEKFKGVEYSAIKLKEGSSLNQMLEELSGRLGVNFQLGKNSAVTAQPGDIIIDILKGDQITAQYYELKMEEAPNGYMTVVNDSRGNPVREGTVEIHAMIVQKNGTDSEFQFPAVWVRHLEGTFSKSNLPDIEYTGFGVVPNPNDNITEYLPGEFQFWR